MENSALMLNGYVSYLIRNIDSLLTWTSGVMSISHLTKHWLRWCTCAVIIYVYEQLLKINIKQTYCFLRGYS